MAKVVTSQGLTDFVSTGKPTEVIPSQAQAKREALAAKLASTDAPTPAVPPPPVPPPPEAAPKAAETATPAPDEGLDPEDLSLPERARRRIGKKHGEMKRAQEEAAKAREEAAKAREEAQDNERFAKQLFDEREEYRKRYESGKETAQAATPAAEPEDAEPLWQEGMDSAKWLKEHDAWNRRQAIKEFKAEMAQEEAAKQKAAADAALRAKVAKAQEKYPDWERTVVNSPITLQNEVLRYLGTSEHGMDLAYHFATEGKADAERIRALDPSLAVAELGRLEDRLFRKAANPPALAAPQAVETTPPKGAPAPITPIDTSGAAVQQMDPAKMSFQELRAYHKERRKAGLEK